MKIDYTNTARRGLREIYEYVAYTLLVPDMAKALLEKIMGEVRSLESLPERNPLYRDEPWYSQGVRFLCVKNYLVFLRATWMPTRCPLPGSCTAVETSAVNWKKPQKGNLQLPAGSLRWGAAF